MRTTTWTHPRRSSLKTTSSALGVLLRSSNFLTVDGRRRRDKDFLACTVRRLRLRVGPMRHGWRLALGAWARSPRPRRPGRGSVTRLAAGPIGRRALNYETVSPAPRAALALRGLRTGTMKEEVANRSETARLKHALGNPAVPRQRASPEFPSWRARDAQPSSGAARAKSLGCGTKFTSSPSWRAPCQSRAASWSSSPPT